MTHYIKTRGFTNHTHDIKDRALLNDPASAAGQTTTRTDYTR